MPDFTASLVGSSTSGDLFICAKDLLVEANPAMWRSIAPAGNILLQIFATGLTQSSKATVIFWTADPRVTARIVLVMIQGPLWSWQVPMASRVYGERHGGDRCGLCRLHEAGRVIGNRPDCAATDVVDAELLL